VRIDRLELRNFKKFAEFDLSLHHQFTLLIGENGAGKTSVLDALAVALGVWLVRPPDSTLSGSRRRIYPSEIFRRDIRRRRDAGASSTDLRARDPLERAGCYHVDETGQCASSRPGDATRTIPAPVDRRQINGRREGWAELSSALSCRRRLPDG
jgi:hypothetical protein